VIVFPAAWRCEANALACVLAAVTIGGCGGGHRQSDQQLITHTVHSYLRAQTAGDGPTACTLLTAGGQSQLIALVVKQAKGLITTRPSCEDAVGLVRAVAGAQLLGALSRARIEHVQVRGTRATAEIVDGTQFAPQQVSLRKTGGVQVVWSE
jgi:hypothetical protein